MSYKVYQVSSLGTSLDHQALFVETNTDGSGHVYQVVGDIQNGMSYGHRISTRPEEEVIHIGKQYVGTVSIADFTRVEFVVNTVPRPKKQFDGPKRVNPQEPLRRCGEWTKEAIQALKDAGVLHTD
jgi:hypothetical protein